MFLGKHFNHEICMQSIATSNSNNTSKKRGRPPGSKNKPKSETSPDSDPIYPTILPPISNSKHQSGDSQKRRPGRPPKVKTSNGTTLFLCHDSFHSSPSQDPIHSDTDADAVLHLHSPIGGRSPVHSHESAEDETAAAVSTLFKSDTDGHGDSGISLQLTLTPLLPTGPVSSPALVSSDPILTQLRLLNEAPIFSSNPRTSFAPTSSSNSLPPANSTTCSAREIGIKSHAPLHSEGYRPLPTDSSLIATHTSSFNATPPSNLPCDPACSTVPKHLCNSVCNPTPPRLQSQLAPSEPALPSPSSPGSKSSLKPSSRKERKANRVRDKGAISTQATPSDPKLQAVLEEIVARLQKVRIASSSCKQPNGGAPRANGSPLSPPVVPSSESAKFTWTRSFSSPAGATCTGSSSESCRLHAFNNFVVDLPELRSHLKRLNEQQPDFSSSDFSLRKPQLELESLLLRTLRCTSDKFTALFGKPKTKAKTKAKAKPKRNGEHSVSPTRTSPSRSSLHSEQPELEDCAAVNASNSKRQSKSKNGAHRSKSVKSTPKHSSPAAARLNSRSDSESSKKYDRRSSSSSSGKRNRALKEESSNRSASNSPLRRQSSSPSPGKDRKDPKTSSTGANSKRKRKAKSKASAVQKPAASLPPPSPPSSRSPSPPDRAKSAQASRRQRDNKGRFAPEPSDKPGPASRSNSREPLHIDVRRSTATSASSLSAQDNKTKHKHHHRHHKSKSKPEQPSPDAEPSVIARLGVVSPETVSFDDFVLSLKANNVVSKLDPRSLRKACKAHSKSARGNDKSTTAIAASVAIPIDRAPSSSGETLSRKELRAILSAATAAQIQSTAGATRTKEVASLVSSLAARASPPPSHPSLDKKQQQRRHKRKSVGSTADRSTSSPPLSGEPSAPSAASGAGSASTSGAVGALPPKKRFKSRPPSSSPPPLAVEREDSPTISPECPTEDISPLPAASTLKAARMALDYTKPIIIQYM